MASLDKATQCALDFLRLELGWRGGGALYNLIAKHIEAGDEEVLELVLAVAMKVRYEKESATLVFSLGNLLMALVRQKHG